MRKQALFYTEGRVYRLESEEHSMVANIGLEVVVAANTVFEVTGIILE